MNSERIVITGYESISALANSAADLAKGLASQVPLSTYRSSPFHEFSEDVPCFRIKGLDPVATLGKVGLRTKDWATKLVLCCAEAGFGAALREMPEELRPGLCVGTAFGSVQSIGDFLSESIVHGVNSVNPQTFANTVINAPTSNVNIRLVQRALSATVSTGFNASLDAITYGADLIRRGYYDRMIVGGLEEVSYYALLGLQRTGALSPSGFMRPFGEMADGYLMGEGCALLMLERESAARERGAKPLVEIAGYASTFESSYGRSGGKLSSDSARESIRQACEMAGISPLQIGFIASGANGNRQFDTLEASLLSDLCPNVPITAYKSKIGECYGASTALSITCALSDLEQERITGVGTYPVKAPRALVTSDVEGRTCQSVLLTSFTCDGYCGSIILRNLF